MWVLIDNYDSFTHILHHYLLQTHEDAADCMVVRNDAITVAQLLELNPTRIILSPGPGTPLQAGITMDVIDAFHKTVPILGVCLGHQAIGMYFGARLVHAPYPMHGKTSLVHHEAHPLFQGIPGDFEAMRYHSLVITAVEHTGLRSVAASGDDHSCMALVHESFPCTGVQFHPESVCTQEGMVLLKNWALLNR